MSTQTNDRFTNIDPAMETVPVTQPVAFAPTADVTPPGPVVAAPVPPVFTRGVTVDAEGAARATSDELAAKAAGFAVKPPIYTIGTMVVDMGVDNFRQSRQEYNALPTAQAACEGLAKKVADEQRQDHKVEVIKLNMLASGDRAGHLHTQGNGTYPLTHRALEGLATFQEPSNGGSFLRDIDPDHRAMVMNRLFGRAYRLDKRAMNKAENEWQARMIEHTSKSEEPFEEPRPEAIYVPREITLRTRNNKEFGREIFATVGPRYGEYDVDKLALQVATAAPDAKCEVTYDGYKAKIDLIWHSNIVPEKAVAGEIFKLNLRCMTSDDGSGAIKVAMGMMRNLCLNFIILDNAKLNIGSRRHIGNNENIQASVADMIQIALGKASYFTSKWSEANDEDIKDTYEVLDVQKALLALVKNHGVKVPGVRAPEMVERLATAWEKEPVFTRAGLINAVTRAAHESTWRTWESCDHLERVAGELLTLKRLDLSLPEEDEGEPVLA